MVDRSPTDNDLFMGKDKNLKTWEWPKFVQNTFQVVVTWTEREDAHEDVSDDSMYESSDSSSTSVEEDEAEDTSTADVATITGMVDGTSGLATLQNSWTATSVEQRNFGFTGQETLCIQAEPSHEGKVWPIDVFSLFISDDIISLIVRETNRYDCQVIEGVWGVMN
ncbi:unnamed protein product [Clavelina lepadiformis]|uniref:Uncharacterized protein n=1 Tax=Clavelina lepadiformis TaxID=159417 RepID=A0ABP0FIF5_CLALP